MTHVTRRSLLRGGAATAAGLVAAAGPFSGLVAHADRGRPRIAGYGALAPVADERDGAVRLELPAGFRYRSFHPRGTVIADGSALPGRHDGMAAFAGPNGHTLLVRNHEINGNTGPGGGTDAVLGVGTSAPTYDAIAKGGTVTVEVDNVGNVVNDFVSLRGTQMNCAGDATPWGTYLSCEETVNGSDVGPDFTRVPNNTLLKHGYVFEVPANGVASAQPIRMMGRFAHEAATSDPIGRYIYLTEDSFLFPSGLYRYRVPGPAASRVGFIADGGTLQMLAVKNVPNAQLQLGQRPGMTYQVTWVDIDDPDPTLAPGISNNDAIQAVGNQGRAKGAATFSRLEGSVWANGRLYFTSTQGGDASDPLVGPDGVYNVVDDGFGQGRGQVWSLTTTQNRERLTCVYESPASSELDLPDNITASAKGSLVLCEDGSGDNFLRGLTKSGELFTFARNADATQVGQEFAGSTFSRDFQTLFVNIQSSTGYSIAIWGPWADGPF